jgi:deoxyhypusine synthase
MQRRSPTPIRGIDFERSNSLEAIAQSLISTGFQASNLGCAIELVNELIADRAPLYLSFTGNIVSSGLREVVTFLVKHRYVTGIVTTASGIEEDAIKSLGSFELDRFDTAGGDLLERGRYRIGNILVPRSLYATFEGFLQPMFARACARRVSGLPPMTPSELIAEIGHGLEDEASFLCWAARNEVPVYCPGFTDGAIGDSLVTYLRHNSSLWIDVVRDHRELVDEVNHHQSRIGAIVLGGGISKHYLLNASFFRGGFDAIVRISTAIEHDGSDSGGNAEEAISWMKLRTKGSYVSVFGEATLVFPLLVGTTFAAHFHTRAVAGENERKGA